MVRHGSFKKQSGEERDKADQCSLSILSQDNKMKSCFAGIHASLYPKAESHSAL